MKRPKRLARPRVVWNGSYKHATLDKIEVETYYFAYARKRCYAVCCNSRIKRVYDRNPENDKYFNIPPNLDDLLTGAIPIVRNSYTERLRELGIEDSWSYASVPWRGIDSP